MDALFLLPACLALTAGTLFTAAGWVVRAAASQALLPELAQTGRRGTVAGLICEAAVLASSILTWPLEFLPRTFRRQQAQEGLPPVLLVPPRGLGRIAVYPLQAWLQAKKLGPVSAYRPHRPLLGQRGAGATNTVLRRRIQQFARDTQAPLVDVVAFGGGARDVLALLSEAPEGLEPLPIGRFIAVAAPLRGAQTALFLPWTRDLVAGPTSNQGARPERLELFSIHAEIDPFLSPDECAPPAGFSNRTVPLTGHLGLLLSRTVYELLQELLRARHAGREARRGGPEPA